MKITKEQLKQIFKEELEATLGEQQGEDNFEESMYGRHHSKGASKKNAVQRLRANPAGEKVYLHRGDEVLGLARVEYDGDQIVAKLDGKTFPINPNAAYMGPSGDMHARGKYAHIKVK